MPLPRFEVPTGAIDGTNPVFVTSIAYKPGTLAAFLNGQLKRRDYLDGWTETDPTGGVFTWDVPPEVGDVVQVFFIDTSPTLPGESVQAITATLRVGTETEFHAKLHPDVAIVGMVTAPTEVAGLLYPLAFKGATLTEFQPLHGFLRQAT